ncbi:MAG: histone deacetylase [Candidatus Wallbacteria bacterium HGW-Wallbacteria-1]|jgi:acetoin utilization deacetylase AcuC-like enzyme|uniref:Histone deacetylase n=1 Tax=Candidatus Wallbacteria bacterium HGW-Wallbacteria-1 TaxID=2013854 RepID=A0A2N1PNL4_9BACT|nr:MAG: histone deacetylase [Candidatus Wallbacteria bacterium HGW-Wallbacteria-1]
MNGSGQVSSTSFLPDAGHTLGIVFFPAFDWAISPDHPEREERLLYTMDQILEEGLNLIPGISMSNPVMATDSDIERAHFCVPDASTLMDLPHRISAGGAMEVARRVLAGEVERGFAMVRPPGHHAMKVVHGSRGFCLVNNEAVMIEYMRSLKPGLRVAIVDTDCHHGDGTQDIYCCDPDTLFISIHQDGSTIFPGTGSATEMGFGAGLGFTVNVPLLPGSGDDSLLYAIENLVMPILEDFKPDIIINSAGQDNHYSDPITSMNVTAGGYARMADLLGAHIAVLEGGYSVQGALPYVNMGIILAMAGLDFSAVIEPDLHLRSLKDSTANMEHTRRICESQLGIWKRGDLIRERASRDSTPLNRRIFYDTDGFLVRESLEWYGCGSCPGFSVIRSYRAGQVSSHTSGQSIRKKPVRSGSVLAISPHSRCCGNCHDRAEALYLGGDGASWHHVMIGPLNGYGLRSRYQA